jgi:hypothetical protein
MLKIRWNGSPGPLLQGPFFEWFMRFQDTILSGLRCGYHTSANKILMGSDADRKLDIFLADGYPLTRPSGSSNSAKESNTIVAVVFIRELRMLC